jgi:hypothetical protein
MVPLKFVVSFSTKANQNIRPNRRMNVVDTGERGAHAYLSNLYAKLFVLIGQGGGRGGMRTGGKGLLDFLQGGGGK